MMSKNRLYAMGYVSDPIWYAITTLERVERIMGQDMMVELAIMALKEYKDEQTDNVQSATSDRQKSG